MPLVTLWGRRGVAVVLVAGLLLGIGCGDRSGAGKVFPVSGKVTVNNQPLKMGSVRFVPDGGKGNTSKLEAAGTIESGNYTLYTKGKAGAPPGWYKVAVVAQEEVDSTNPNAAKTLINPIFNDPEKSSLSIEVLADPKPNAYDLSLSK